MEQTRGPHLPPPLNPQILPEYLKLNEFSTSQLKSNAKVYLDSKKVYEKPHKNYYTENNMNSAYKKFSDALVMCRLC